MVADGHDEIEGDVDDRFEIFGVVALTPAAVGFEDFAGVGVDAAAGGDAAAVRFNALKIVIDEGFTNDAAAAVAGAHDEDFFHEKIRFFTVRLPA